jgi:hypothetical protein
MNQEIKRYLDEHGATYTPDALRSALIQAGHDPAEVDAALAEWHANPIGPRQKAEFRRWTIWLHISGLVAMAILVVALNGIQSAGAVPIAAVVLAIFLAIGWMISALIGGWLLPRAGLTVALLVPAASALLLSGTCVAIMNGLTPPAPHPGSMELRIEAPTAVQGSGDAQCFLDDGSSISVNAEQAATLDGKPVAVNLMIFDKAQAQGAPGASLFISIGEGPELAAPRSYSSTDDRQLNVTVASDRLSGEMRFEQLPGDLGEPAPGESQAEPISGSVSWRCR